MRRLRETCFWQEARGRCEQAATSPLLLLVLILLPFIVLWMVWLLGLM